MHHVTILLMRHAIPSRRPPPNSPAAPRAVPTQHRRGTHQASWHKTTVERDRSDRRKPWPAGACPGDQGVSPRPAVAAQQEHLRQADRGRAPAKGHRGPGVTPRLALRAAACAPRCGHDRMSVVT